MVTVSHFLPQWTKKVVTEMTGRDPLGLARVSNIITDYLLTGIITTTDRARYYSFYCWAIWHISMTETSRKYQDFVDGLRRREAVVALATISNNPQTSPAGVQEVRKKLEKGTIDGELDCNFRVLPSNPLGGYGAYYSGSLYELGLIQRTEGGIDHVTEGDAEELAEIFHTLVEKTPYIKKQLYRETRIPLGEFQESKRYLTLDALFESFANEERQKLIDIFFGFTKREPNDDTVLRRLSLAQILHIVSEYQRHGFHVNERNLDWYLVYPTSYYDVLWPTNDKAFPYICPRDFAFCKSLWKQFCLQQFLSQALESLMYSVLETVGSESAGLDIDSTVSRILQDEFFSIITKVTGKQCDRPYELLLTLGINKQPNEESSLKIQKELSLLNPKSEAQILAIERRTPQAMAARTVLILSVLYGKWRGMSRDPGFTYVTSHAGIELWTGAILRYLDCWLNKETTWTNTLRTMIENFVLDQHDRIMFEKRRLDSCWMHLFEGRIFKDQDYGPRWRSSRHSNAVSVLHDLGLLTIDDVGKISITSEGETVLKKILS